MSYLAKIGTKFYVLDYALPYVFFFVPLISLIKSLMVSLCWAVVEIFLN